MTTIDNLQAWFVCFFPLSLQFKRVYVVESSIALLLFIEAQALSLPLEGIISDLVEWVEAQTAVYLLGNFVHVSVVCSLLPPDHSLGEFLWHPWVHLAGVSSQCLSLSEALTTMWALVKFLFYWCWKHRPHLNLVPNLTLCYSRGFLHFPGSAYLSARHLLFGQFLSLSFWDSK